MTVAAAPSCVLHVAALPFPSRQGTQAAIRAMLEAEARAGRPAALFTYPTSAFELTPSFAVHRSGALGSPACCSERRLPTARAAELRSGPSWLKLWLDARMGYELRRLIEQLRPRAIVAHHVEAAALTLTQGRTPSVFFAHTDLAAELPSYAVQSLGPLLRWAGGKLDRFLARRSSAVASVSPALPGQLGGRVRTAHYVPLPWSVPPAIGSAERQQARRALGLAAEGCVALYAGNLDAYQDPDGMLAALAELRRRQLPIRLLLASASEPDAFLRRAARLGVPVTSWPLDGEARRRQLHAAADLAIVPRAVAGGLPIKLLDALARGVPCAVSPHAAAGLGDSGLSTVRACDATPAALAAAIAQLAGDPQLRGQLSERGRAYVAEQHSDARYLRALDSVLAVATRAH